MPPESWFRKKTKFSQAPASSIGSAVPDGVATKCAKCAQILFTKDLEKNLKVCPNCGFHHKLSASERIEYTFDPETFQALHQNLRSSDPLKFPDYLQKLDKYVDATGLWDGVVNGVGAIGGVQIVCSIADFRFKAASMGAVAGEKIVRAMEEACARRIPLVVFTASGGARMEEGLLSLMQMAKTSAAAAKLAADGLPYVVVMTDATVGGVLAAYGSLGDIIIAEPGATIGLAGARVVAQTALQKPPVGYQTAEWQLEHGHVDQVILRKDIPAALTSLLQLLGFGAVRLPADVPIARVYGSLETVQVVARSNE